MKAFFSQTSSQSIVRQDQAIADVLVALENSKIKCLMITDPEGNLVGTLTDGDIRRASIRLGRLPVDASQCMNKAFVFVRQANLPSQAQISKMLENYDVIPIVNESGRVVQTVSKDKNLQVSQLKEWGALVMAGGRGSRLSPLTDATPKPLLRVGGLTILDRILWKLSEHGFAKVFISTGYLSHIIREHLEQTEIEGLQVEIIEEDFALGTMGAAGLIENPPKKLLVTNGDVLTDQDLLEFIASHNSSSAAMSIMTRKHETKLEFGVVEVDSKSRVSKISEKPTLTSLVNCGVYALEMPALRHFFSGGPLDATTLIEQLCERGLHIHNFESSQMWIDIGRPRELELANSIYSALKS